MNASIECEVLIIGGGPAGSTLARALHQAGINTCLLDKQDFPRDKVCAGWVTPPVLKMLDIDLEDYAASRTLQPIHGFRFGLIGGAGCTTRPSSQPISYGILRREFDAYLLQRSDCRLFTGEAVKRIERRDGGWRINDRYQARLLVGAGGHFCPVARYLRADLESAHRHLVTAKEAEFRLDPAESRDSPVRGDTPEIYFSEDLSGYGWVFRKGAHLNVGLGLLNTKSLPARLQAFEDWLRAAGRLGAATRKPDYRGHAYTVFHQPPARLCDDGVMLIGDAAGLAHPRSGEGIRPAVESALLAAGIVRDLDGDYRRAALQAYEEAISRSFAPQAGSQDLPEWIKRWLAPTLLRSRWFVETRILDNWLMRDRPPVNAPTAYAR